MSSVGKVYTRSPSSFRSREFVGFPRSQGPGRVRTSVKLYASPCHRSHKGFCRRMSRFCWHSLLLCCIVLLRFSAVIVGDEGGDFLDLKEDQVVELSNQAFGNHNRQCELLATCNNQVNCSHSVCEPLRGDLERLTCTTVVNSPYCPALENGPCTSMNLDYTRSHIRVSATTSLKSTDTMLSICSQRGLDPLMKSFTSTNLGATFTRSHYATMDGSWRAFPGSARSVADCREYDPRNRPWFRTSTSVVKVVTVLIDLAASMNGNLHPSAGVGSLLQAAKIIASQLLTTLSAGDHVNIIVFNSTGAFQLSPQAILVKDHEDNSDQPELQPLLNELNNQAVESEYRQSNLTAAILTALPNFKSNAFAAKVILVLSDTVFANLANVTLPSASLSGVKLFLYKLPWSNDMDVYLANNTLTQQLCAVGGHFEPLLKNLENPLLALNKYFSYLANLKRIETDGRPQYSPMYKSYERFGGDLITAVIKTTFTPEGDLIGSAGITLNLDLMGNLTNPVKNALLSRITGYSAPTKPIILTAANCTVVKETTQPCGVGRQYHADNGGLCPKTDFTSTIQDLSCCGACRVASGSGKSDPKGLIIGFSVTGSIVVLVGLGVGGYLFIIRPVRRRKKAQRESDRAVLQFPGSPVHSSPATRNHLASVCSIESHPRAG